MLFFVYIGKNTESASTAVTVNAYNKSHLALKSLNVSDRYFTTILSAYGKIDVLVIYLR